MSGDHTEDQHSQQSNYPRTQSTRELQLQQQQMDHTKSFQDVPISHSYSSGGGFYKSYPDSRTPLQANDSYGEKNGFSSHDGPMHLNGDTVAFLGGGMVERGGTSPDNAARERYIARKEAQQDNDSYPYGTAAIGGAGAGSGASRGCFSGKRKWAWIVGAIVLIAAVVGIAVGVSQSKSSKSTNSSSGSGSGSGSGTGTGIGNSDDPSKFSPTPGLYKSFYGMAYTPLNSQYPACGDTLQEVIKDVQLMSQLTTKFRVYGADCDVASLSLEAIQRTKVDMTVLLAAWVPQPADDPNNTTWTRQMNAVISAIKTYGADHVEGVAVGNEFLLNGGSLNVLTDKISQMRSALAGLNLSKTIPVGTGDAGSFITTELAEACDFVGANVHAWFGGVPVDQAAGWVYDYTSTNTPASALQASNKPKLYIAETGWPTNANSSQFLTYEGAVAGISELNTFLETYVCQANQNITSGGEFSNYFFFEMFDEPWKAIFGGVEEYWGLFNANKTLKEGLKIPNCPIA